MGYGHAHFRSADIDSSLLYTFKAADGFIVQRLHLFACEDLINCPECCLHDAAGGAEDEACTGAEAEGIVKCCFLQVLEIDAAGADHAGKLLHSDGDIHVLESAVVHFGALALKFLRSAGHHGHTADLCGIYAFTLRVPGLDHRTEHLLRGLCRGEVRSHSWFIGLQILDPGRAAGGEHGQRGIFRSCLAGGVGFQAVQKLRSLLHDGEVRGEIGVEDPVETEALQGSHQAAGADGAGFFTEGLRQGDADRRSDLDDQLFPGAHFIQDPVGEIVNRQRSGRAVLHALAAVDAVGVS